MNDQPRCPESGDDHEYDAGHCVYCDAPIPVETEPPEPPEPAPDAWLDMALEDALSGGLYS